MRVSGLVIAVALLLPSLGRRATAPVNAQGVPPQASADIPGTIVLPPGVSGGFGHTPIVPGVGPSPGGPVALRVSNESDQTANVTFTGTVLTATVPQGYLVRFVSGCSGPPANPSSCSASARRSDDCSEERQALGLPPLGPDVVCEVAFTAVRAPVVAYAGGWNLVSLPPDVAPAGVYYGLLAGQAGYVAVPTAKLDPAQGYWAYFGQATTVTLSQDPPAGDAAIGLPAAQFVLIGNPYNDPLDVSGADLVYIYDASARSYEQANTLQPGQGAWAYSVNGGAVTLSPDDGP